MSAISKLGKAAAKYLKSGSRTRSKIKKMGVGFKNKIHKSDQKYFKNAEEQSEVYNQKLLKDKKHVAGRSKQKTRIIDAKKRAERTKTITSKKPVDAKNKSLKRTAVATAIGGAAGAAYEAKTGNTKKAVNTVKQVVNRAKTASKKK
jgi:hypothetical protein